jgi:hypothetical protein
LALSAITVCDQVWTVYSSILDSPVVNFFDYPVVKTQQPPKTCIYKRQGFGRYIFIDRLLSDTHESFSYTEVTRSVFKEIKQGISYKTPAEFLRKKNCRSSYTEVTRSVFKEIKQGISYKTPAEFLIQKLSSRNCQTNCFSHYLHLSKY